MINYDKCIHYHTITSETQQYHWFVQAKFTRKTDLRNTPLLYSMPYLSVLVRMGNAENLL